MRLELCLALASTLTLAAKPPSNIQCQAKLLAYEFASQLLPERAVAPQGLAEVALGLGVDAATKTCTGPSPPTPKPPGPPPPPPRPPVPKDGCTAPMVGIDLVFGYSGKPIVSFPKTNDAAACIALCKANASCTVGTWHDKNQHQYANRCLILPAFPHGHGYNPKSLPGHTSFMCHSKAIDDAVWEQQPYGELGIDFPFAPRRFDQQQKRSRGRRPVSAVPPLRAAAPASTLYVDASSGSDSAAGTLSAPLKTIAAAVAKAAALAAPRSILLRKGTFYVKQTIRLGAAMSGTTIAAYQQEEVVVSGGVELSNLKWKKTASLAYGKPPPPGPPIDTYVAAVPAGLSFVELFNASTKRMIPARHPNGDADPSCEFLK